MKKRKFDNKKRYLYALIIAIFLFVLGFITIYLINHFESQRVSALQDKVFYNFYNLQLNYIFFNDSFCNKESLEKISFSLDAQSLIITQLENQFGKDDKNIRNKKKYYYLLEVSHFSLMKELKVKCNFDYDSILFFYSNQGVFLSKSEEVGRILNYVKNKNPNVLIYSFDFLSEDDVVKKLKSFYGVNDSITLIINEKIYLTEIKDANDIFTFLN